MIYIIIHTYISIETVNAKITTCTIEYRWIDNPIRYLVIVHERMKYYN